MATKKTKAQDLRPRIDHGDAIKKGSRIQKPSGVFEVVEVRRRSETLLFLVLRSDNSTQTMEVGHNQEFDEVVH